MTPFLASYFRPWLKSFSNDPVRRAPVLMFSAWLFLAFVNFIVVLGCATIVAGRVEKQYLDSLFPATYDQVRNWTVPYFSAVNTSAAQLGFRAHGHFTDGRSQVSNALIAAWMAPEGDTFAVVEAGTVAKLPYKRTKLYTLLKDGRVFLTRDDPGTLDISGLVHAQLLLNAGLDELYRCHRARIAANAPDILPIAGRDPLTIYHAIQRSTADRLVQTGQATYADPHQTAFRLTIKGSAKQYFCSMFSQVAELANQEGRDKLQRPGR